MNVQTSPPSLAPPPLRKKEGGKTEESLSIPLENQRARVGWLVVVVSLLLAQFFLRAHNPESMAGFIDEARHINRAQAVYQFEQNPMEFSHGKLLLYYWLGLFSPSGQGALAASRLSIALVSLITSASIGAVARILFGRRAMLPALLFYVLAPHAVFYERMALADPLAGALAALTAWQCIILVRAPTRRRGIIVGLLISATTMAKLTTALILGLPVTSVIILATLRPRRRTFTSIKAWSSAMGKRYRSALNPVRNINGLLWIVIGSAAFYSYRTGANPVIIDTALLGFKIETPHTIGARLSTLYEIGQLFISRGMLLLLLVLVVLLLIRQARTTLFVLIWLTLLVAPSTLISWQIDARYLLIGQPALAVLFGGGIVAAGNELSRWVGSQAARYKLAALPALASLSIWGCVFALPFDWNAAHNPAALEVPPITRYIFFAGPVNAWGTREAIYYLETHVSGPIPTVMVLHTVSQVKDFCDLFTLYLNSRFIWTCQVISDDGLDPPDAKQWPELLDDYQEQPVIYVISDRLSPDRSPDNAWHLIYSKQRPHGGKTVTLWRVEMRKNGA